MQKKYLVFISSSQEDLKAERRELAKIITELGAIPVTMDAFNINNPGECRIIHKAINECDYFINLTAYKCGEMVGKSFALEEEYLFAKKAGIPVLALLISEKARWKASKKEKSASAAKSLESFKKKLEIHPHDKWTSLADLRQKATALLCREINLNPRRGWVPGEMASDPSVANAMGHLIQENKSLRNLLKMEGTNFAKNAGIEIKQLLKMLSQNTISLSFYYTDGENWENLKSFRFSKLFRLLAPEMNFSRTTREISHFLGNILNPDLSRSVRKDYPVPSNTIKKIMADFHAHRLVECAGTAFLDPEGKKDEAFSITEFGKEVYAVLRIRQMHARIRRKNISTKS